MSDSELHGLERTWRETGAATDLEAVVSKRGRVGQRQERFAECRDALTANINDEETRSLVARHDPLAWTGFAVIENHSIIGGRGAGSWTSFYVHEGNQETYRVRIWRNSPFPHIALINGELHYVDSKKHLVISGKGIEKTVPVTCGLPYQKVDGTLGQFYYSHDSFSDDEERLTGTPIRATPSGLVTFGYDNARNPTLFAPHFSILGAYGPITVADGNITFGLGSRFTYDENRRRIRTVEVPRNSLVRIPTNTRFARRQNQAATMHSIESAHSIEYIQSQPIARALVLELPLDVLNTLRALPKRTYR